MLAICNLRESGEGAASPESSVQKRRAPVGAGWTLLVFNEWLSADDEGKDNASTMNPMQVNFD
jgi:hypothetical protein